MGLCGATDNPLFGATRNPFDLTRNSGGSSGGSAAAVADGLVPFAEGSDGGGSIRIPSSWCGVYGFQPSFGRVPNVLRPNGFFATQPYLYEGPITRTVADAALALTALNGEDPRDPFCILGKVDFRDVPGRSIEGMRIGYSPDLGVYPVDPRVAETVRAALEGFRAAGAIVEDVTMQLERTHLELAELWTRTIAPLNLAAFETFKANGLDLLGDHRDDFPPEYLYCMDRCASMTAVDVISDNELRTEVFDAIQAVLADHDLLVSPTLACLPVENAATGVTVGPTEINGERVDPLIGWCMTYFTNFSGHPAASIPAGFADGLPVGLQIIGRRQADADVLAASAAFERERPWFDSYARVRERSLELAGPVRAG
jgi:amidase/aspartyl-tRNA(Asn)/glutamyl-tRNA(Gln) amidotransferase subunit A